MSSYRVDNVSNTLCLVWTHAASELLSLPSSLASWRPPALRIQVEPRATAATTAAPTARSGTSRRTSATATTAVPSPLPPPPRRVSTVACQRGSGTTWRGLVVAPECRCSPYDRDDYPYPQSVEPLIAERQGMRSPYDGTRFASLKESDIEHVVSISEAHDSGLCAASAEIRRRFARDLDNLTLATPALNRYEKRGLDAAEWLPEAESLLVRQDHRRGTAGVPPDHRSAGGRRPGSGAGEVWFKLTGVRRRRECREEACHGSAGSVLRRVSTSSRTPAYASRSRCRACSRCACSRAERARSRSCAGSSRRWNNSKGARLPR